MAKITSISNELVTATNELAKVDIVSEIDICILFFSRHFDEQMVLNCLSNGLKMLILKRTVNLISLTVEKT